MHGPTYKPTHTCACTTPCTTEMKQKGLSPTSQTKQEVGSSLSPAPFLLSFQRTKCHKAGVGDPDSPLGAPPPLWLCSLLFPSFLKYLIPKEMRGLVSGTVETKDVGNKHKIEKQKKMPVTKGPQVTTPGSSHPGSLRFGV